MTSRRRSSMDRSPPMPADPAAVPPPEWAVRMSETFWGAMDYPEGVDPLARLLASVREGALREAARTCASAGAEWAKYPGTDNGAREVVCDDLSDAILSLLHAPPSGGAG